MPTNNAAIKSVTRDIGPLSLRASVKPGTCDTKKRTVDVIWTTGARVLRGFWDKFYEELSLDPAHVRMQRLQSGKAPLLDSHDSYSVDSIIGVVESARLEAGQGVATVRFPAEGVDPETDCIFRKVADGIIANISVGYRVFKMEQVEVSADKVPVMRAVDWEPTELSLVPMGADSGAATRSAELSGTNPCEFIASLPSSTNRSEDQTMPTEPKTTTEPKTATPVPAPVAAPATDEATRAVETKAREEATLAERKRVADIRLVVRKAKLEDKFADELISGGSTVDQARTAVLEQLAAKSDEVRTEQHTRVEMGESADEKFQRGASAWLFERAGVVDTIRAASAKDPVRFGQICLAPGEFRGLSLTEMARECLERRGFKTRGMSRLEMVGHAFTFRSGAQGTSDFAVLFENVMHKVVLGAYSTQADTWSRFCKTDTVPDFRPSNRYRTGSFGTLDSKNEMGEFKNKAIPDGEKTSISTGTKGNIIALSREAIINDDMSALADLGTKFGRAARLSIETDVYALLNANSGLGPTQTDGQPFFHSNRKNVATGAALSAAGLDADRVMMAKQKDVSSNEYLDLRPAVLLVPLALGGEAKILNDAQYDPADSKFQKPNKVRGMVRDVVDTPRLTDADRRYIFADPGIAPAIVVAFLEGQGQAPVLESKDGWRVDGTEWKVRLDYKAQMFDARGAVTNAGK